LYCCGWFVCITFDLYYVNNYVLEPSHNDLLLKKKIHSTNKTYIWHIRLGHTNSKRIQRLVKNGLLGPLDFEDYLVCESRLEGNMTKMPFFAKAYRAKDLLELVYIDVCGPISV
jgi:hypothetical protein